MTLPNPQVSSTCSNWVGSFNTGAGGGTRTHTVSPPTDFESVTSTIPSHRHLTLPIISDTGRKFKSNLLFCRKNPMDLPGEHRFPLVKGGKRE